MSRGFPTRHPNPGPIPNPIPEPSPKSNLQPNFHPNLSPKPKNASIVISTLSSTNSDNVPDMVIS